MEQFNKLILLLNRELGAKITALVIENIDIGKMERVFLSDSESRASTIRVGVALILDLCFNWDDTPQGKDFWSNLFYEHHNNTEEEIELTRTSLIEGFKALHDLQKKFKDVSC